MLELSQISVARGGHPVLEQLDLIVRGGEIAVVAGRSGAGKTSLLRVIAGLDRPLTGEISWRNRLLGKGAIWVPPWERPFAMVFQDLALWPHMTVLEHLLLVLRSRRDLRSGDRKQLALSCLAELRIGDLSKRYPAELSGGQQQRVALARSLVHARELLLLDEPFSYLDEMTAGLVWSAIDSWRERTQGTILCVTHDSAWADTHATRSWNLQQGRLREQQRAREAPTWCIAE